MEEAETEVLRIIPHILRIPYRRLWIDYDEEADVLYINFVYPSKAVEHEEDENGIIKNYDEHGNLVGLTIIGAKRFLKDSKSQEVNLNNETQ
ncbi:MAG: DUF2283 domain-containing protein [Candidatus Baldrarchaeia archaeon]